MIFKTALTDTATRIAAFEAGGVDCVTSPMQIEEVMARIRTHLSLHTVQKRLEQARDELEDRVRQRTAEFHRLNRELRAISECNQTWLRATDEQTLVNLHGAGRQGHYGLHGMRERAELAGGQLTIRSEPSRGTEVDLIIPASTAYTSSTPASETVERLEWRGRAEE